MEVVFHGGGVAGGAIYWKSQIGIREEVHVRNVPKILLALECILAPDTFETLTDIWEVAARLEERIFIIAASKGDYDDKITKTLTHLKTNALHHRDMLRRRHPSSFYLFLHPEIVQQKQQSQIIQAQSNLQEALSSGNCRDDRISILHDSILHHIMSFLSAREVVRTSVLSPRWRSLWAAAPCLDIDIDHFGMDRAKFNEFAESLFLWRGIDTLDTLRLHSFAIDAANFWIDHAIKRNVQSIEFTEYTRWQSLYLNPHNIDFSSPYLRSLKLTNVILVAHVFDPLNHACPTLENLQLVDSVLDFPEISSRSLKTLEIIDCSVFKHLLIRTHKLVSLCFKRSRCKYSLKSILATPPAITLFDLSNANSIELSAPVRQVAFNIVSARHAPMLESVTLKLKMNCERDEYTIQTAKGISFAAEHLKKVTIYCSESDERVPLLATIFHVNASSLECLDIKTY